MAPPGARTGVGLSQPARAVRADGARVRFAAAAAAGGGARSVAAAATATAQPARAQVAARGPPAEPGRPAAFGRQSTMGLSLWGIPSHSCRATGCAAAHARGWDDRAASIAARARGQVPRRHGLRPLSARVALARRAQLPGLQVRKAWVLGRERQTLQSAACEQHVSVTAGSVLHGSHLGLRTSFLGGCLLATHDFGISARQLCCSSGCAAPRRPGCWCAAAPGVGRPRARSSRPPWSRTRDLGPLSRQGLELVRMVARASAGREAD